MASGAKVRERFTARVTDLSGGFASCLEGFEGANFFTGPSFYFHQKTVARRLSHSTISSLLGDEGFFDLLYATLTAWGLHRMGPGNTKLRNINVVIDSFRAHLPQIESLSDSPRAETRRPSSAGAAGGADRLAAALDAATPRGSAGRRRPAATAG